MYTGRLEPLFLSRKMNGFPNFTEKVSEYYNSQEPYPGAGKRNVTQFLEIKRRHGVICRAFVLFIVGKAPRKNVT